MSAGLAASVAASAVDVLRSGSIDAKVDLTTMEFASDGIGPDGRPSVNDRSLLDRARSAFGGVRPRGYDAVFILTGKDIFDVPPYADPLRRLNYPTEFRDYGIDGYTDCLGGIALPDEGFAAGELSPAVSLGSAVFSTSTTLAAVVMAHEIAHVFGARHEEATCEGAVARGSDEPPCSLMFPYAGYNGPRLNASERVTALEYLAVYGAGHS